MVIKEDIFSVADLYDTFFVDMYGVLFDGSELYRGTLDTLKKLCNRGIWINDGEVKMDGNFETVAEEYIKECA